MSIKFGDKDYALVPDRLKLFREENPRAKVDTNPTYNEDGSITFKATILKDKADPNSAEASGSARYTENELKKPKAFEKLETISVGRALANLGYLNDGQVATTEEMEEYEHYRLEKYEDQIENAKSVEDLMVLFNKMKPEEKKNFTEALSNKKKELLNAVSK
jgi:hypothetical protein